MIALLSLLLILVSAAPAAAIPAALDDITVTGTATLVNDSNYSRKALSCTNTSTTVAVRWGDSTATATRGQRIPASSSVQIIDNGAIYMISEGANVTMSCTKESQ
jgi:hypothetical protein